MQMRSCWPVRAIFGFLAKITILGSSSGHVTVTGFKSLRLNSNQHTAHTMVADNPDFETFESNFRAIIASALGKNAALQANLCPNASDPRSVRKVSKHQPQ